MPDRRALFRAYALPDPLPDTARPHVRMNFVESADGAVTISGRSEGLGGRTDRELMQVLRAMADVVVVGAGTVRVEGYGGVDVDDDLVAWRRSHGLEDQPALAVVSGGLRLEPGDDVFLGTRHRPVLVTTDAALRTRGDAFAPVATLISAGIDTVDLRIMLDVFAERGWTRVLCEGGPHLFGSLLGAGLVDEVCVTLSPLLVGGDAGRIVRGADESARRVRLLHALPDEEGFVFLRYRAGE